MIYIILGIVLIFILLDGAVTFAVFYPPVLWALLPLALPIVARIVLNVFFIKPAERRVSKQKSRIEQKYKKALYEAKEEDRKLHDAQEIEYLNRVSNARHMYQTKKQQYQQELDEHRNKLANINVIGTNPKTKEYIQKLIGYIESMRADSIKEAIHRADIDQKAIDDYYVQQFQESLRNIEIQSANDKLIAEAERTRIAAEKRAEEAKRTSDAVDQMKRDLEYELNYGKRP